MENQFNMESVLKAKAQFIRLSKVWMWNKQCLTYANHAWIKETTGFW